MSSSSDEGHYESIIDHTAPGEKNIPTQYRIGGGNLGGGEIKISNVEVPYSDQAAQRLSNIIAPEQPAVVLTPHPQPQIMKISPPTNFNLQMNKSCHELKIASFVIFVNYFSYLS